MTNQNSESIWRAILHLVTTWDPKPIPAPQLDPQVASYPALKRTAEILRFRFHQLEWVLSAAGTLRAWLWLWLRIFLVLNIPALLLVPILTLLFSAATGWAQAFRQISINTLVGLVALSVIAIIIGLWVAYLGTRRRRY